MDTKGTFANGAAVNLTVGAAGISSTGGGGVVLKYNKLTGKWDGGTPQLGKPLVLMSDWINDSAISDSGFSEAAADAFFASLVQLDKDQGGKSACYDACAANWPPLLAEKGAKAEGDYGLEYLEHHFGPDGSRLKNEPRFQMRKVAGYLFGYMGPRKKQFAEMGL